MGEKQSSTCPSCQNTVFEAVLKQPKEVKNINCDVLFIQCASCGAVIGAQAGHGVSYMVDEQCADKESSVEVDEAHLDITKPANLEEDEADFKLDLNDFVLPVGLQK